MTKPLRVHFDQMCLNARGTDAELRRLQELHDTGKMQLVANRRHAMELKNDDYGERAKARLRTLPQSSEFPRWGWSGDRWGDDSLPWGAAPSPISAPGVWAIVFPNQQPPRAEAIYDGSRINSLHDVMRIVNAHEDGADVFLTREKTILRARERLRAELALRPRIESPTEFLLRFPSSPEVQP